MRCQAAAFLFTVFTSIGCGEGPHVVSAPPPPPQGLRLPSDLPTVPPLSNNDVNTTTEDWSPGTHGATGTSGRTTTGGSSGNPTPVVTTCTDPPPTPDAVCMQACGGPVVRAGDPPPPFIWLTPAQAENRRKFGCPRCLPEDARIATPMGNVRVIDMRPGMPVFTLDEKGNRITGNVERIGSAQVLTSHMLVQIELSDGRTLRASPGHPTADSRLLGSLQVGDRLDNATIQHSKLVPYGMPRTFDILPSGKTGAYWANGVLIGSTLRSEK